MEAFRMGANTYMLEHIDEIMAGRRVSMEEKYHHLWLLFRERMARRAGEAASTEKKEMYDWGAGGDGTDRSGGVPLEE